MFKLLGTKAENIYKSFRYNSLEKILNSSLLLFPMNLMLFHFEKNNKFKKVPRKNNALLHILFKFRTAPPTEFYLNI